MFKKILIANRGEIAVRIVRACQELGIRTVAVYSDADATALHTVRADEAVHIGPPAPAESYLRGARLIEAARQSGCEAIHPGYGFLSENADFAEGVHAAGLIFVGPTPAAMRQMGTKTASRTAMQAAGVRVVPGYQASSREADLLVAAKEMGFPLLVKAAAGGGGKGMRLVHTCTDLADALQSARHEAQNAFGNDRLYLEKYLTNPRHVEFQVFGDSAGNVVHLFERECSIQRRHQKIIEESPSPLFAGDADLRRRMGEAAVAAARAVGYRNAGTVEFLVDAERSFYFLEMNTRLQVEHPVTELVTGLDLVKLQLRVAAGEPLPFSQADLSQRGQAIECRIYAEDPANDFLPATGRLLRAVEPSGPGVRVDTGLASGDEVSVHYDPMIAKLIVLAEDRPAALARLRQALHTYVLLGITTNIPFLRDVIAHEAFQRGAATTEFVDQHFAAWTPPQQPVPDIALAAAALAEMSSGHGDGVRIKEATGNQQGDAYSPWDRLRDFRMGTPPAR